MPPGVIGKEIIEVTIGMKDGDEKIDNEVAKAGPAAIAIISPDGHLGMKKHAADLAKLQIPFIFDPGQQLPQFDGAESRTITRPVRGQPKQQAYKVNSGKCITYYSITGIIWVQPV